MLRFRSLLLLVPTLSLIGCGGGSGSSSSSALITLSVPATVIPLDAGQSALIMPTLTNDFNADGATFTLNGPGTLTYPPSTILSSPKLQCYYNAPSPVAARTSATLTVTSVRDTSKSATVTFTIYPGVVLPKLSPMPQPRVGIPYSLTLQGSGGAGPLNYVVVNGSLPPGLSLAPATGIISGTATTMGSYTVTIQAQDRNVASAINATASQDFTFQVS